MSYKNRILELNRSTPDLPNQIPKPKQFHLSQIFINEDVQIKCINENATKQPLSSPNHDR